MSVVVPSSPSATAAATATTTATPATTTTSAVKELHQTQKWFPDIGDSDIIEEVWIESENKYANAAGYQNARGTQTDVTKYVEHATQTVTMVSMETQTEEITKGEIKLDESSEASLSTFLRLVYPVIEHQLITNLSSHAFDDYNVSWEEERDSIMNIHHLYINRTITADDVDAPLLLDGHLTGCSDITWNCNGTILAVSFGRSDHAGWCSHRASLCLWNIMRRVIRPGQADIELELPCCMMSMAAHPEHPTIIAGGLFNGEIRIWDTSNSDEPLLMTSLIEDCSHREPIAQLVWIKNLLDRAYYLVSVAGDGKILFWSMDNKLAHPIQGACLIPSSKYQGHGNTKNRFPIMGGTCMAFSKDAVHYTIGTELGGVLRGQTNLAQVKKGLVKSGEFKWTREAYRLLELSETSTRFELKRHIEKYARLNALPQIEMAHVFAARPNPVHLYPSASHFAFESHSGPVYGMTFSPFNRNLFLTCSTDGTLRLYHVQQPVPLLHLEPSSSYLFDVVWSPARPLVFACGDRMGRIYVYDLLESMLGPVLTINEDQYQSGNPTTSSKDNKKKRIIDDDEAVLLPSINALAFNPRDASILSSCDDMGRINVWQLSAKLSTLQNEETNVLMRMGAEDKAS